MNKVNLTKKIVIYSLIMLPVYGFAQEQKPRENKYFPRRQMVQMTYTHEAQADFKGDDSEAESAEMHEVSMRVSAPLYFAENWRLMSGLSLQWNHFNFTGGDTTAEDTYIISVPFKTMIDISEKWMFMGTLAPSIYSDLERISEDSLKASVIALGMYKYSPTLTMAIGAAYSRIFGINRLFPAVGLTWQPTPQWKIDAMFPRPSIAYAPTYDLRFFTYVTPAGSEWDVQAVANGEKQKCTFRFKGYRAGIGMEYDIMKHLSLDLSTGVAFKRDYEVKDKHDTTFIEEEMEDTWFAQVAFRIR